MEICGCTGCSSADPSEPDSSPSEYTDIFGDFIPPHLGRRDSQDIFKPAPPPSDDDVQWEDEGDTFERVTPQEHEMLRERFEAADTDASGKLEMGELRALLARLGVALGDEQLSAWLAKYDKDHDATISLREFVGIFEHLKAVGGEEGQLISDVDRALFRMYVDGLIAKATSALGGFAAEPPRAANGSADAPAPAPAPARVDGALEGVAPPEATPPGHGSGRLAHGHTRDAPRHQDADTCAIS